MSLTIYDKIWNDHLVHRQEDGTSLLFVDRHLIHEVTSPQAFESLRNSKRKVRQPKLTLAVADHNVPTTDRSKGIADEDSKIQVETLEKNLTPVVKVCGEPQLGKRGLYLNLSTKKFDSEVRLMMDLITWSDGTHTLIDIAEICEVPIWDLYPILDKLVGNDLIELKENNIM